MGLPDRSIRNLRGNQDCYDGRKTCKRKNVKSLTEDEKQQVIHLLNLPEVRDLSVRQAYFFIEDHTEHSMPCSLSTAYRIVKGMYVRRDGVKSPDITSHPSKEHIADRINKVWSWDITYLHDANANNKHYYVYCALDIYSRKIVGCKVFETQSGANAATFFKEVFEQNGITTETGLTLHADNGTPMKSKELQELLEGYNVTKTHSRPSVSDDNAFSESAFKTLKYSRGLGRKNYMALELCQAAVDKAVEKYNNSAHSGIKNVSPNIRHSGREQEIEVLHRREEKAAKRKEAHPERFFSGKTADYTPAGSASLRFGYKSKSKSNDVPLAESDS